MNEIRVPKVLLIILIVIAIIGIVSLVLLIVLFTSDEYKSNSNLKYDTTASNKEYNKVNGNNIIPNNNTLITPPREFPEGYECENDRDCLEGKQCFVYTCPGYACQPGDLDCINCKPYSRCV